MAARRLTDQTLENFTIQIYQGIPYVNTFTYNNPNGTAVDLTGMVVSIKFKDVFPTQLELYSNLPPSALGSSITITDAVNGEFKIFISEAETLVAGLGKGRWWIQLDDELLWIDSVKVCEI